MATRFRDLSVGDVFRFTSETQYLGMAHGPWVKESARRYRHSKRTEDFCYQVGSINAEVTREPANA